MHRKIRWALPILAAVVASAGVSWATGFSPSLVSHATGTAFSATFASSPAPVTNDTGSDPATTPAASSSLAPASTNADIGTTTVTVNADGTLRLVYSGVYSGYESAIQASALLNVPAAAGWHVSGLAVTDAGSSPPLSAGEVTAQLDPTNGCGVALSSTATPLTFNVKLANVPNGTSLAFDIGITMIKGAVGGCGGMSYGYGV